jgi:LPXTG-motif cell wall-anchored protein
LGTFNTSGPDMLLDALNQGLGNCAQLPRIVIDKHWVGTGSRPPSYVPAAFTLTVTSTVSATDSTLLGTATCTVASGKFRCDYRDQAEPAVARDGLLVATTSVLTVRETGFPGNTVDITFPVDLASRFVSCPPSGGPCLLTITNTPPPPPTTSPSTSPTTEPSTSTPTPPSTAPTTSPSVSPVTLPATGSRGTPPLVLLGVLLVPLGAVLVFVTRRRAAG